MQQKWPHFVMTVIFLISSTYKCMFSVLAEHIGFFLPNMYGVNCSNGNFISYICTKWLYKFVWRIQKCNLANHCRVTSKLFYDLKLYFMFSNKRINFFAKKFYQRAKIHHGMQTKLIVVELIMLIRNRSESQRAEISRRFGFYCL